MCNFKFYVFSNLRAAHFLNSELWKRKHCSQNRLSKVGFEFGHFGRTILRHNKRLKSKIGIDRNRSEPIGTDRNPSNLIDFHRGSNVESRTVEVRMLLPFGWMSLAAWIRLHLATPLAHRLFVWLDPKCCPECARISNRPLKMPTTTCN